MARAKNPEELRKRWVDKHPYYDRHIEVMRHYNYTIEYLKGKRTWSCPFVDSVCTVGTSPHCGGCRGEHAMINFWGLTQRMFAYLECAMREEKYDTLKEKVALAGGKMDEDGDGNVISEEEAVRTIQDPLYNFPYDEPFMTSEEVRLAKKESDMVREAIAEGKAQASPEVLSYLWDDARIHAALNGDDVARRAAVNDYLWLKYKNWMKDHRKCSADRLKWFVEVDLARASLYPKPSIPAQRKLLEERLRYEAENNLPKTRVSPLVPPPLWYIEHLRKQNVLEKYMTKVNAVLKRKVDDLPE